MRLGSLVPQPFKSPVFREWMMIIIGALIFVTLLSIDRGLDRNLDADMRTRGAICRSHLADGIPLRQNCKDKALIKGGYFDPEEQILRTEMKAICHISGQSRTLQLPEGCPNG